MTREEMLKERDRLASTYVRGHFQADTRAQCFRAGFSAAMELMERERVKPLREACEYYGFKLVPDSLNSARTEITTETGKIARQALAKVEELE